MTRQRAIPLSLLALLCLLLGAATTVGVAWWMANEERRGMYGFTPSGSDIELGRWYPSSDTAKVGARWLLDWRETRRAPTPAFQLRLRVSAGWPLAALDSEYIQNIPIAWPQAWRFLSWEEGVLTPQLWPLYARAEPLPVRPLRTGFVADTAVYAVVWWLLLLVPQCVRRFLRVRRGMCPACAYDLKGTPHGPCPECGRSPVKS